MNKYTILVTTYNRANTLKKCLDSLFTQEYKNFEVIVLDDKSNDNTLEILKLYKDRLKIITNTVNQGVAISRNELINHVKTPYFLFVDSDDYIEPNLLAVCDKYLVDDIDILSFCYDENDEKGLFIRNVVKEKIPLTTGEEIIKNWILNNQSFDTPVCYIYNTLFFKKNDFRYKENRNLEDFALTPYIILKAKKMISINDVLYHAVLTKNSIVRTANQEKLRRNIYDKLYHFDNLIIDFNNLNIDNNTKKVLNSFLANSLLNDVNKLNKNDNYEFIKELKKRNIHQYLLNDTLKRKLKKLIISINYKFISFFRR